MARGDATTGRIRPVRRRGVSTAQGSFMSSPLPVAGFAVIEAATLADAVGIVSRTPCAVVHGAVEVWPLEEAR
jgi:hypothetical protein